MNSNTITSGELAKMISDGFEVAKRGDALRLYNQLSPHHDEGLIDPRSHYAFGWIIYYALHQSHDRDIDRRKHMLARYLKLQTPRPHKLHSMILTEAVRLYKDAVNAAFDKTAPDRLPTFSINAFTGLWNLAYLRPGDHARKEYMDKELSSTVDKLLTCLVDECERKHTLPADDVTALLDAAIGQAPDAFNLLSQRATLHIIAGERQAAAELLQRALLSAPGKFFLWSKLAMVYDAPEELNLHVALLCKALRAPGQEQFKGRIRCALAEAFASRGLWGEALWEINHVKQVYQANNWHLPHAAQRILSRIPADTVATNPQEIYRKVEHLVDDELYRALPRALMTKDYHKNPDTSKPSKFGRPRAAWRLTDNAGQKLWIHPEKFGINPDLPIGTRVMVSTHNGKPVRVTLE